MFWAGKTHLLLSIYKIPSFPVQFQFNYLCFEKEEEKKAMQNATNHIFVHNSERNIYKSTTKGEDKINI